MLSGPTWQSAGITCTSQCNPSHIFSDNARRRLSASCFLRSISSAEHWRLGRLLDVQDCFKPSFVQAVFGAEEQTLLEMICVEEDFTDTNRSCTVGFLFLPCCSKQTGSDDVVFCVAHATVHAQRITQILEQNLILFTLFLLFCATNQKLT